ncbi:hypothetical protein V5P93_003839 [Actinokineospora auranticolor]|uniref:Uncharacterized protein n=1 Tax=Actinokineospora auranticolor TaxID=155976 RepID=A0A2S6GLT7_9PSEU|nr:hypothetical protein [Actinokineospora auranticolor]PPK66126.1 hypothetical protein CLV40_11190 [Actinokineospora auranticolor]
MNWWHLRARSESWFITSLKKVRDVVPARIPRITHILAVIVPGFEGVVLHRDQVEGHVIETDFTGGHIVLR